MTEGEYVTGDQILPALGSADPREGMAVIVIVERWPTAKNRAAAVEGAAEAIRESFARRGIPTPPDGWRLLLLHPDEDWRQWISPHKVPEVTAGLAAAGPSAVPMVIYAVPRNRRRSE